MEIFRKSFQSIFDPTRSPIEHLKALNQLPDRRLKRVSFIFSPMMQVEVLDRTACPTEDALETLPGLFNV